MENDEPLSLTPRQALLVARALSFTIEICRRDTSYPTRVLEEMEFILAEKLGAAADQNEFEANVHRAVALGMMDDMSGPVTAAEIAAWLRQHTRNNKV